MAITSERRHPARARAAVCRSQGCKGGRAMPATLRWRTAGVLNGRF